MASQTEHDGRHRSDSPANLAGSILLRLFGGYSGALMVRLWDGKVLRIGNGPPSFTLSLRNPGVLRDLVLFHDPVRLAEAYFGGDVDVAGDFDAAMGLRCYLENLRLPFFLQSIFVLY